MTAIDEIIREAQKSLMSTCIDSGYRKMDIKGNAGNIDDELTATVYIEDNMMARIIGEKNIRKELKNFPAYVLTNAAKKIRDDYYRYYDAKIRLIQIACVIAKKEELVKLLQFIDTVCQSHKYVGRNNRVYLNPQVHLRLADKTGWDNVGELHLQMVVTEDGGNVTFHFYPEESEEDLLKEVLKADI